jgi:hypothetical protein
MAEKTFLEKMTVALNDPATDAVVRANRHEVHEAVAVLRQDDVVIVMARLGVARIRPTSNRFVVLDSFGRPIGGVHCGIGDLARALTAWNWGNATVDEAAPETTASAARLRRKLASLRNRYRS